MHVCRKEGGGSRNFEGCWIQEIGKRHWVFSVNGLVVHQLENLHLPIHATQNTTEPIPLVNSAAAAPNLAAAVAAHPLPPALPSASSTLDSANILPALAATNHLVLHLHLHLLAGID